MQCLYTVSFVQMGLLRQPCSFLLGVGSLLKRGGGRGQDSTITHPPGAPTTLWPVSRGASTFPKDWLQTHPRNEEAGWGSATILILRDSKGPHSAGVGGWPGWGRLRLGPYVEAHLLLSLGGATWWWGR